MPTQNPPTQQPYPIGYQREGFPELMGWAEVVQASNRTDTSVRQMRGAYPNDFPQPVFVVIATPLYLADEIRAFFLKFPRIRTRIDDDKIREIQGLVDGGTSYRKTASILDLSLSVVAKYAAAPRI